MELTDQQRAIHRDFRIDRGDDHGIVALQSGESDVPVEIADLQVQPVDAAAAH